MISSALLEVLRFTVDIARSSWQSPSRPLAAEVGSNLWLALDTRTRMSRIFWYYFEQIGCRY
jgi:hypothetical protein